MARKNDLVELKSLSLEILSMLSSSSRLLNCYGYVRIIVFINKTSKFRNEAFVERESNFVILSVLKL